MSISIPSILSTLGLTIGTTAVLTITYKLFRFVDFYFFPSENPLQIYKLNNENVASSQAWALITGSSRGIGYGYAQYLLSLDFGVILLARTGVQEAEIKLKKLYPNASIKTFTMDCSTASIDDIKNLVHEVADLPITILINNVGGIPMPWPHFRAFKDYEPEDIQHSINMNAAFGTHLALELLPHLTRNASPRSLILNVTSAARWGMPYLSIYSATKGYVTSFSHTLTRECKYFKYPIDTLLIVPGDVLSDGNNVGMSKGAPLASDFAKMVLERVDKAVKRGKNEMMAYWLHGVQMGLVGLLPESMMEESIRVVEGKRDEQDARRKKD